MSVMDQIRSLSDSIDTVTMSTDELLANAQAAMRWRDEVGESAVEIYAEQMALRFWEALDERLRCGEATPASWIALPKNPFDPGAWFDEAKLAADPGMHHERELNEFYERLEGDARP